MNAPTHLIIENSFECGTLFVFNVVTHFAMRFEVHLVRQTPNAGQLSSTALTKCVVSHSVIETCAIVL